MTKKKKRSNEIKKFGSEFKKFILRGNIIDLAVAVAVGAAFNAIVNSFVKDIIGGIVGYLTGGIALQSLYLALGTGENAPRINYGNFIEAIIYFLIVAFVMFVTIKMISGLKAKVEKLEEKYKKEVEDEKVKIEEEKAKISKENETKKIDEHTVLLREIRDLLKK